MANISNIINNSVPAEITNTITGSLNNAILILKAIGVLILIYIIFVVIKWIMDMLRNRRIKKIYEKVNEIDEKVDMLLDRSNRKKDKKGK
jgi:hypothetical protein